MKVDNKLIKKYINNICLDIDKIRKHKDNDLIKNINTLLGKKCLKSPFILDSIRYDKNQNVNSCFGVVIIPSYNNIKMISSKIKNEDDIDNISTALFKTSKLKFDIVLDKRIFEQKIPLIFTNEEITVMIFHQILNLFDETFKNQIILNYTNLIKYENGYGGTNSLVYSSFCNIHSKIYDKPVHGDINEIDKKIVILGFYKQLISSLSKIDNRWTNDITSNNNSMLFNFVNSIGVDFGNNKNRIELINKFNKNNKITSVDLSVVNYYNEEENNMDNDKYELSFLHEAYFGKSKNILQNEFPEKPELDQLKSTNKSTKVVFEDVSPLLQQRMNKLENVVGNMRISYLNGDTSEVRKNERELSQSINDICRYFNKKIIVPECKICTDNGNSEDDMFGARAVFTSIENIKPYVRTIISMENMEKVLHSALSNVSFNLEIDHNILSNNHYNFSDREIVAIILHELGHMLDVNIYSRIAMAYQSAIINLSNIKSLKNNNNTRALCALYVISNIEADRLFSRDRKSITVEEIRADSFVGNLGLSNDLNSAIDKFYKINKHSFFKNKNFKEMISDAENFVQASMVYCGRKRKINRLILTEKIKQTSDSIKSLLNTISEDVLKYGDDKITNGEVYIKDDNIGGIVNESFDFIKKFKKSPNKISSYDIDTLRIQSDMIEDINDKQIMMYKIFKRKNQITQLLSDEEFKKENRDYYIILQSYMNTLNDLYEKVMNVKINNQIQKYGVFIKYPKGYEG